ncbi:MAG: hypothetical protein GXP40_08710, partial [Chloroflexi bacterium]|nr:hypothetical protein [Chloroflexota bacterium]
MAFRITILLKAIRQLGFSQMALYGLYKMGLRTGYFRRADDRRRTIAHGQPPTVHGLFTLPPSSKLREILGSDGLNSLLSEANQIAGGRFRIFGGELVEIELGFEQPLSHWTAYETREALLPDSKLPISDIKFLWEPARFGWAFTLGRAYRVSGDDKYAEAFWRCFETFDAGNPPYLGPHWMSGQEVALRLMAFVWSAQVFGDSPESTRQRKERLAQSVAEHAARIPPTLLYARAQNNNHLLSEAAGLFTAALALPDHPQAGKWRRLGEKWMAWCFENQIDGTGEYIQHSVTYQRLMLQLALWVRSLNTKVTKGHKGKEEIGGKHGASSCALCLTEEARQNLAAATRWLAELTDPVSGRAVNLGADDGAYIFPLANGDFRDIRPVAAAAARVFLDEQPFGVGVWDEMSLWFEGLQVGNFASSQLSNLPILKSASNSWAYLRVADGNLRLAHADQLHLDLWWRGENVALDPGTYLYNAAPPWDNPWPATQFHNTVTVNGLDQMTRAGRFMYLDWARGCVLE